MCRWKEPLVSVCLPDSTRSVIGWRVISTHSTWTCSPLRWTPTSTVCPRGHRYAAPLIQRPLWTKSISSKYAEPAWGQRVQRVDEDVGLCSRCCWGCWQAQRSSSPHGAAVSTPRSLTTSCHWPAARSGSWELSYYSIILLKLQILWSDFARFWYFSDMLASIISMHMVILLARQRGLVFHLWYTHIFIPTELSPRRPSLLCRFGLLPLSMSNVRKSKSASRASDATHQLVSSWGLGSGIWCCSASLLLFHVLTATCLHFHCFVSSWVNAVC